jgi:hypothetical protein
LKNASSASGFLDANQLYANECVFSGDQGPVTGVVGIEGGAVSEVINLESSGVAERDPTHHFASTAFPAETSVQTSKFVVRSLLVLAANLRYFSAHRGFAYILVYGDHTLRTPAEKARIAVVAYSLGITGFLIVLLILAQPLGLRFDFGREENLRLIDVILPTFFGYLGAASHFIFNANRGREIEQNNALLLKLLIHGPFLIFIFSVGSLFFAHYVSHQPLPSDAPRIDRMDFGTLSRYLSICLALLAATVSVVSSYLFGSPPPHMSETAADTSDKNPNEKMEGS